MNISPIAATTIPSIQLNALSGLNASVALSNPIADPSLPDLNASIVDFSTLARLLSATRVFQAQQAQRAQQVQQESLSAVALNTTQVASDTTADFGQLVTTANLFVDAFNQFQSSSFDNTTNLFGASFDNALLLAMQAQSEDGQSLIASLAQVGINFQEAADPASPSQFNLDLNALQAAFDANPVATSALLAKSLQALSEIEVKLLAQNVSLFAPEASARVSGNALASQFDANAVTSQLSSLSTGDARTVNVALQRLLSDEALINALDSNPIAAQTVIRSPANALAAANDNSVALAANAGIAPFVSAVPSGAVSNAQATSQLNPAEIASAGIPSENALAGSPDAVTDTEPGGAAGNVIASAIAAGAANVVTPLARNGAENLTGNSSATIKLPAFAETAAGALTTNQAVIANPVPVFTDVTSSTEFDSNMNGSTMDDNASQALSRKPSMTAAAASTSATSVAPDATANSAAVAALATAAAMTSTLNPLVASTNNVAVSTSVSETQMHLPFIPLNPLMAAAVAAYRLGDVIVNTPRVELAQAESDTVAEVGGVARVAPVTLDLHDSNRNGGRNGAGRNAVQTPAQSELFSAVQASLPGQSVVDVSV
ncbi:MAG: hypothetical protein Q7T62_02610 [Undibacterium sp.]|nr:hypothetical protein [Undibacterium sp.]